MTKRLHEQVGDGPAKKRRVSDALDHLSEHADDLIECLQALKSQDSGADPTLKERLAALSREILPSIRSLSKENKAAEETPVDSQPEVPILTQWRPSEVSCELPPLPPILDPSLERASFTHAGKAFRPGERNYEQLEWLGDAYLYLISTAYIFLTFPHIKHGDMCHIREILVRNATLKDYSLHYGFDKRAIFPPEYGFDGRQGGTKAGPKERAKVLGDIFEAHVAAIILSDPVSGVSKTASWLKALWSTTISEQIKQQAWQGKRPAPLIAPVMGSGTMPDSQQSQHVQRGSARDMLSGALALHQPRVQIEFRSLDEGRPEKKHPLTKQKLFTQGAFLLGYGEPVQLGRGTATKKSEANEKAAQNALDNKKLMSIYQEKKRAIQENKRATEQGASKGLDF